VRPDRGAGAGAGGLARGAHRRPRPGAPRAGRAARRGVRWALPESALGRPAAARGRRARARGRPAAPPPRRALRGARPDHADRAAARVPRTPGAAPEDRDLRDERHARGGARGGPDRAVGRRAAAGGRHAGGAGLEPGPRGAGVPRGGGGVSPDLLREVAAETGRHVVLVAVSIGIATAIGVPLGVFLTRRPAWSRPVLGLVGVIQTIPSLALFGFLIPVPAIGGIGTRTALVALTLYGLLPVLRNTVTGIEGVDAAIRAGGLGVFIFRGVAMVDDRMILAGALPAALLAIGADVALGVIERALRPPR